MSLHFPPYPQLGMEKSFWLVLSAVPEMSPPNLLHTPSLLTFGRDMVGQKPLMLCKYLFSNSQTLLCYAYCSSTNAKLSIIWDPRKKLNSIPARPQEQSAAATHWRSVIKLTLPIKCIQTLYLVTAYNICKREMKIAY